MDDNVLIASNVLHRINMQMPFEQNKEIDYEVSFPLHKELAPSD